MWVASLCLEMKKSAAAVLRLLIPVCLPSCCEGFAFVLALLGLWLDGLRSRPSDTAQSL